MKKILFVLTISTLFSISSLAQTKVSGGLIGGLNLAKAYISPYPTGVLSNNNTGFGAGAVLDIQGASGLGLRFEPMYIQNGTKLTSNGQESKFKINYIEIPIMLTYSFEILENQIEPYIMGGTVLGARLSAKLVDPSGTETDEKDIIQGSNFSYTIGAGIKIPVNPYSVFIESRYTYGFSDINNDPSNPGTTIHLKGLAFFAGITYPFGS